MVLIMTNLSIVSDLGNIKSEASGLAEKWLSLMKEMRYEQANILCINFIEKYGSFFRKRDLDIGEKKYNQLLVLLIFFKGLQEYVQLCQTTQNKQWFEDNSVVEHVWIKLCDCRERIEFSLQYCHWKDAESILCDLAGLLNFFTEAFGVGNYLSLGIVFDRSICNICHQDFRACSHVERRLYNGKICFYQPVNPQPNHVAIVKKPKDLRCRIWSWNMKEPNQEDGSLTIENACVLTTFSVDDFLQKFES